MNELIGSAGVALLLLAFLLNLGNRLTVDSQIYQGLNFVGASLACWASLRLEFYPFVVLEGVWALVALVAIVRRQQTG